MGRSGALRGGAGGGGGEAAPAAPGGLKRRCASSCASPPSTHSEPEAVLVLMAVARRQAPLVHARHRPRLREHREYNCLVLIIGLGSVGAFDNLIAVATDVVLAFMATDLRVAVAERNCQSMDVAGFVGAEPSIRKIVMQQSASAAGRHQMIFSVFAICRRLQRRWVPFSVVVNWIFYFGFWILSN